ncbi:diaminobutyrate acetyltransferase [Nocardia sp. PE-7]|uniref:diaminobutyrate acetyltransferase n=1 Tax=Nocardia sp. PE-7 TaxID=3058426 RepID=UPI002658783A|nr:diaminobutyrate acetyltransferase [Nocardia sp. PE-7]WKG07009.1 diaminobutyrate acetyltransferase [Nocardia sp. PE-7]
MTTSTKPIEPAAGVAAPGSESRLRHPRLGDGAQLWRIARDSQVLDVNSSYAYLLWCRDFSATSLVAEVDGQPVGFVIGYVRPEAPDTLFVWQIAVDAQCRGRGLAAAILHGLLDSVAAAGITTLETTISPGNTASHALFSAVARERGADLRTEDLFEENDFPDSHEAELLYVISPAQRQEERR